MEPVNAALNVSGYESLPKNSACPQQAQQVGNVAAAAAADVVATAANGMAAAAAARMAEAAAAVGREGRAAAEAHTAREPHFKKQRVKQEPSTAGGEAQARPGAGAEAEEFLDPDLASVIDALDLAMADSAVAPQPLSLGDATAICLHGGGTKREQSASREGEGAGAGGSGNGPGVFCGLEWLEDLDWGHELLR